MRWGLTMMPYELGIAVLIFELEEDGCYYFNMPKLIGNC